jgi:hypothetical protein
LIRRTLAWLAPAALIAVAALVPARADELSDLRANYQLLQQKLAAAQGAGAGASQPVAGKAAGGALQGSFPRSFVVPGTGTSVRVGGNLTESFVYRTQ